eukprot:3788404-Rhodomonas_salina.1
MPLSALVLGRRITVLTTRMSYCCCYAKHGTETARAAISLRCGFSTCGTEIAYGAIRLRCCYAMCCTEIAYGAMAGHAWRDVRRPP